MRREGEVGRWRAEEDICKYLHWGGENLEYLELD